MTSDFTTALPEWNTLPPQLAMSLCLLKLQLCTCAQLTMTLQYLKVLLLVHVHVQCCIDTKNRCASGWIMRGIM